jgi:Autotransporter beta-domain
MLRTGGTGGMLRKRLGSHPTAGRRGARSTRWPILMPVSAVALMTWAPSGAYAQCFGSLNAFTSAIGTVNTAFLPSGSAFLSSAPNSAPDQQGGGVWTRAVGGRVETQADTNFSASFSVATPSGPTFPIALSEPCRASVKQNFAGFEAGHDIALLNSGNSDMNWHFGVLAGYVGVNINTPQEINIPGQSGNVDAPSVGLYTAFSKGSFSADVQARLYNLQAESLGQRLDGRGYSLTANMGYRFDLPGNWSLEPSVGGIFSRTSIDPLAIAGVPFPVSPTAFVPLSGALQFQDVESALGRASVTLGTSLPLAAGQIVAYPFVTASVFHEFEGNVTASIALAGTIPIQGSGNFTASSIGTYGQFGVGSAFELPDTAWLGFARLDYRTGDNIQGYSVSAGRTWGGMHWAFQGGTVDPDYAGYLAGGQAGYNDQTGHFVWGVKQTPAHRMPAAGKSLPNPAAFIWLPRRCRRIGLLTERFGYTWGGRCSTVLPQRRLGTLSTRPLVSPAAPGGDEVNHLGERLDRRRWHGMRPHGQVVREGRIHALSVSAVHRNMTATTTTTGNIVRIGVNFQTTAGGG